MLFDQGANLVPVQAIEPTAEWWDCNGAELQLHYHLSQIRKTIINPNQLRWIPTVILGREQLDLEVYIVNPEQSAKSPDVRANVRGQFRLGSKPSYGLTEALRPFLHQLRHVDPKLVTPHLDGLIEREGFCIEMELRAREYPRVTVKEPWWPAAHHTIERCYVLLAVEQHFHYAGRERPVATMGRRSGFGGPDE